MRSLPLITFLIGLLVGAVLALLYAPSSGEELRDELARERAKALDELNRVSAELRDSLAETRGQLTAYVEEAQAKAEEAQG